MNLAIILSIVAGLSTLIGCIFLFFNKENKLKALSFTFVFSFIIIFFICTFDLAPSSYKYFILSSKYPLMTTVIFISLGVYLGKCIDKIDIKNKKYDVNLYRVGILSFIALILHNIPEGIITYVTSYNNISFGLVMCIAIAIHNIPEGIMISIPIYYSTGSKKKGFLYTLVSALSEPLGALIAYLFLSNYINDKILGIILAFVCGLMLHIIIDEVYPLIKIYNDKKYRLLGLIFGIFLVIILEYIT